MIVEGTFLSIIPPLVAIVLCIILREAIVSLLLGVIVGAFLIYDFSITNAFFRAFDEIILDNFTKTDNAIVLIFTVLTGGVTGILSGSITAKSLIAHLAARLHSRSKTMLTIWFSGILIFIDDYANCLIIGNAYRGICDRLKISREKLAYIVDTTSAPIASLALVSTWIGIEISLINDSLAAQGVTEYTGYGLFIASIPYRFYPVLALVFCFLVAWTGRDFGPMRKAEQNMVGSDVDHNLDSEEMPLVDGWSYLVLLPLLIFLSSAIVLLISHGYSNGAVVDVKQPLQTLISLFSNADPFRCLLWATLIANVSSWVIHLGPLCESFSEVNKNWFEGCKGMFIVCVILTLAWSIGGVCSKLDTGAYVASLLGQDFNPAYLPLLTFIFAALISFSTGTSYGTMSILMPIALPIALTIGLDSPEIISGVVGSVLGGSIFGDHCSPLSDTTILSSGASGCEVTAHVNTQLPYAILVGVVSLVCLFLIPYQGMHVLLLTAAAIAVLTGVLFLFGKKQ